MAVPLAQCLFFAVTLMLWDQEKYACMGINVQRPAKREGNISLDNSPEFLGFMEGTASFNQDDEASGGRDDEAVPARSDTSTGFDSPYTDDIEEDLEVDGTLNLAQQEGVSSFSEEQAPDASVSLGGLQTMSSTEEGDLAASETNPKIACSISYPNGYTSAPLVKLESEKPVEDITAVMLDFSARCWFHGFHQGIKSPSAFTFGSGENSEYVDIHPPEGSGKHRYTIILFRPHVELGPLLGSLTGSPWNNKDRGIGSYGVVMEDLQKTNDKVHEVGRCEILVSKEDIEGRKD